MYKHSSFQVFIGHGLVKKKSPRGGMQFFIHVSHEILTLKNYAATVTFRRNSSVEIVPCKNKIFKYY